MTGRCLRSNDGVVPVAPLSLLPYYTKAGRALLLLDTSDYPCARQVLKKPSKISQSRYLFESYAIGIEVHYVVPYRSRRFEAISKFLTVKRW